MSAEATFFCGGSRHHPAFIDLFDAVFVLIIDRDTLLQRLEGPPDQEIGALQLAPRGELPGSAVM